MKEKEQYVLSAESLIKDSIVIFHPPVLAAFAYVNTNRPKLLVWIR